jgi:hypothetical protein
MSDRKGIGGRRRLNPEPKTAMLSMRVTPAFRARVEASKLAHSSPSTVQEVERLIGVALDVEEGTR